MQNEDNQCFKWCVARALNPVKRVAERITKILRVQAKELNWNGITFPMLCTDTAIGRFEKQNTSISVNVFGAVVKGNHYIVYPHRISKAHERKHEIDLLLVSEEEEGSSCPKQHYCIIKSLSRLVSSQISKA